MILYRLVPVIALLLLAALPLRAETAAEKGLRIAKAVADRTDGYADLSVSGEMILIDKGGRESTRRFDAQWVENNSNDGSRALLIFRHPGDIRNTALLTHSYSGRQDDQWLYLPALSRVRRISSSGRSGSFVGSEFAYEDMVDQEVDKFEHLWVRDEACPAVAGNCHVLDRVPRASSGYSRQRVWIDIANLRVQQVVYFDRRGAHLKTLEIGGYQLYEGRFWRASRMLMRNHLTGKATRLIWDGYRFNVGINPNRLTPNALKRIP